LFNTALREAQAIDVVDHLEEGWSIRATSRRTQVAKETVARLLTVSGRHAQRFHDHQVHDLRPRALACDDQGSFVKKKQQNGADDAREEAGAVWDHTAVTADRQLLVALVRSTRTQEQTHKRVGDTQSRLQAGHLPLLSVRGMPETQPPCATPVVVATPLPPRGGRDARVTQ
jgi:hypothetical protein